MRLIVVQGEIGDAKVDVAVEADAGLVREIAEERRVEKSAVDGNERIVLVRGSDRCGGEDAATCGIEQEGGGRGGNESHHTQRGDGFC
jgi:hypothetical protein